METETLLRKLDQYEDICPKNLQEFNELKELLDELSQPQNLKYLLDTYTNGLLSYCEEYDFLTKVALYHTPNGKLRLRLNLFLPGYANRIHHHRWDYMAKILRGGYIQSLYGKKQDFNLDHLQMAFVYPDEISTINKGDIYYLHRDYVHSISALPNTISLCLRGPAKGDKFWVMDPKLNTIWWQYGEKLETYEEKQVKSMSQGTLQQIKQQLITLLGDN